MQQVKMLLLVYLLRFLGIHQLNHVLLEVHGQATKLHQEVSQ